MALHPQVQEMLALLEEAGLPRVEEQSPEEARRGMRDLSRALKGPDLAGGVRDVGLVADEDGREIPARVYAPRAGADTRAVGLLPIVVWYHGGGWVIGDLETHDVLCRWLAQRLDAVIVAVDYRLAPEHRFPAAAEDAWAAVRDVARRAEEFGGRADRIAVAGDSAGGNLAAVASLMARDRGGPEIGFQALIYPITDCDLETPSYEANAEGYLLTRPAMAWFWDHYVPREEERVHPYVSPLRAESLRGLPPAWVVVAGHDPLRDEGVAYARRLADEGGEVVLSERVDMVHGFLRMTSALEAPFETMDAFRREMDRHLSRDA